MIVKGKIYKIGGTQKISEKFSKREFVIETDDKYPQKILLQLSQDKCNLIDVFNVGQEVEASINLRGREWIDPKGVAKYFNTLEVWKLHTNETNVEQKTRDGIEQNFVEDKLQAEQNEQDDLPF